MNKLPKVYRGEWIKDRPIVYVNDLILTPKKGEHVITYAPDFAWGTRGSGAAQLAISILLDYLDDPRAAIDLHQDFKWTFLVTADPRQFQICSSEIDEFLIQRNIVPWHNPAGGMI